MKKNLLTKKIVLILLSSVFVVTAFAQNIDVKTVVPEEFYEELMEDGYVLRNKSDRTNEFTLLPNTYFSEELKKAAVIKEPSKTFPFTYEGLYYISKADILKESNSTKETIDIDDIAKVCRSVSKMEGMEYYSHRRHSNEILYEKCYMFNEADLDKRKPTPIPDQNTGNADGQISYCLQDDSSFGVNKYKLVYHQNENELFMQFILMDKMGIGPFNALYPERMKINLLILDCGDDLLLYLCTDVDAKRFPGIEDMIEDSMTARMEAVYNWFKKQF